MDSSPGMENPPLSENVLERQKYHSMLNMDVLPDSDSEVVVTENDKKYEDPTQIFVKSRVTVCMLILSVVTLSVCLISVIFFVRLEEGVQNEEKLYVLGKLVFIFACLLQYSILRLFNFSITCKKNQLAQFLTFPRAESGRSSRFRPPTLSKRFTVFSTRRSILSSTPRVK